MSRSSRACPVCCATRATPRFENRMAPISGIDMSYRVSSCDACGFTFADQLPEPHTYDLYYQALSKYDSYECIAQVPTVARLRAEAVVTMCAPYLSPGDTIADLGCGAGVLLGAFKSAGWHRLIGIDPAPSAPACAKTLFNIDGVRSGTLQQASECLPLDQCALVCLTGVLEHLPSLRTDIGTLVEALPDRAKVLVEVPALERFMKAPIEPFGEFSLEHIQYFSAVSLTNLFASFGMRALDNRWLELPNGTTDSLLGLYIKGSNPVPAPSCPSDTLTLASYIKASESAQQAALKRIARLAGDAAFAVFGAGSHTARLLPQLEFLGLDKRIIALIDNNPNLHGNSLGRWPIHSSEWLASHPAATVLVSSFRGQTTIDQILARHFANPRLLLYPSTEDRS